MIRSNNTMKLLVLTDSFDERNGWGRYSSSVAHMLQKQNVDVVVVGRRGMRVGSDGKSILLMRAGSGIRTLWYLAHDFFVLLPYVLKADIVHSFVEHHALTAALYPKKFFITAHGTYMPRFLSSSLLKHYARFVCRRAAGIVCVSTFTRERIIREYPQIEEKSIFLANGVDIDFFSFADTTKRKPIIITVGAVKQRKAQDVVVRALPIILKQVPDAEYYVVGDRADDNFNKDLDRLIEQLGLQNNVTFFSSIDDAKLRGLYHASSVCVLPSRIDPAGFEGFPLSLLEAASTGTPVIGTRGCGAEHLINHGENGFLLEKPDPEELARHVSALFTDRGLFARLNHRAREVVEASFSWSRHTERLITLYEGSLKGLQR